MSSVEGSMHSSIIDHLEQCMHVCVVQTLSLGVSVQLPGSNSCKPRGINEGVGDEHIVGLVPGQHKVASQAA